MISRQKREIIDFFELVRAGLWEKEARLSSFEDSNFEVLLQLAEEQGVVGLLTAGFEHVVDAKLPQIEVLQIIGQALQIEQRNVRMNDYLRQLFTILRNNDVYALLVKGQGVAQCYERPLWRASGDIDLFLSDTNYNKAKKVLMPLASVIEPEVLYEKHIGMTIDGWIVELHGNLRSGLSHRIDRVIDEVQKKVFFEGDVRSWLNGNTQVFLPGAKCDYFFLFTHILKHFFKEGVGLRQICDWCRLLYKYGEKLDTRLLESQIRRAGLMTEWKAFAAVAVNWLGMPAESMPLYSPSPRWVRKANKIIELMIDTGSFGRNRDDSYYVKYSFLIRKTISFWRYTKDSFKHFSIFPFDALKAWFYIVLRGVSIAVKGR